MKMNKNIKHAPKGVTLIELTVVIAIILVLISVLFVGATYYKTNADKAACVVNISNLHKAMRSVQNVSSLAVGDAVTFTGGNTPIPAVPTCPGDGSAYNISATVTATGTPGATCGSATFSADHVPATTAGW
ncbi:type II secretion system protein [Rubritalea tangerina]|uniref:Type II secretion system protein n=1 Tax=Rubritalea tangerina TaxID=430798 RepID=A0ABW4Z6T1_9BACT